MEIKTINQRGSLLKTAVAENCFDTSGLVRDEAKTIALQNMKVCKWLVIKGSSQMCTNMSEMKKERGGFCGSAQYISPTDQP